MPGTVLRIGVIHKYALSHAHISHHDHLEKMVSESYSIIQTLKSVGSGVTLLPRFKSKLHYL